MPEEGKDSPHREAGTNGEGRGGWVREKQGEVRKEGEGWVREKQGEAGTKGEGRGGMG